MKLVYLFLSAVIAAAVAFVTVYLLTEPVYTVLCDGGEVVTPAWKYN